MSEFIVYTKPDCPNCEKLKDRFDAKGITYAAIDITKDAGAYAHVTTVLGYRQVPVAVNTATGEHWSGVRPDKIVEAAMNRTAALAGAN